jgi:hypothetical protein
MNQAQITLVCIGVVLPALFAAFVLYLTRAGKGSRKSFHPSIDKLRRSLHEAMMAERNEKPLKRP